MLRDFAATKMRRGTGWYLGEWRIAWSLLRGVVAITTGVPTTTVEDSSRNMLRTDPSFVGDPLVAPVMFVCDSTLIDK
jgi:hypothetical protein